MTSSRFDWQEVLNTWDVFEEERKAVFLDILFDLYKPEDHTYTGLYQQFKEDAPGILRDALLHEHFASKLEVSNDPRKDSSFSQAICDI